MTRKVSFEVCMVLLLILCPSETTHQGPKIGQFRVFQINQGFYKGML